MATGTVKWFNTTKGFGFIQPDEGGKDVFVHISAVERSGLTGLADDQKVTYDLETGRDGRQSATNLSLALRQGRGRRTAARTSSPTANVLTIRGRSPVPPHSPGRSSPPSRHPWGARAHPSRGRGCLRRPPAGRGPSWPASRRAPLPPLRPRRAPSCPISRG